MKITVSVKNMRSKLNQIDFANERVTGVDYVGGHEIAILIGDRSIKVYVDVKILKLEPVSVNQDNQRWDWLCNLLDEVQEQPVTLTIGENTLKATFEF